MKKKYVPILDAISSIMERKIYHVNQESFRKKTSMVYIDDICNSEREGM